MSKLLSKIRIRKPKADLESSSQGVPTQEAHSPRQSQSFQVTNGDRDRQTHQDSQRQPRSADAEDTTSKFERKQLETTKSYKSPTNSGSGRSAPFIYFTDANARVPRAELDGSSPLHANVGLPAQGGNIVTSPFDEVYSRIDQIGSRDQDKEEVEQGGVDTIRDLTLPIQSWDPQTKEAFGEDENHSVSIYDEMGQSNSAYYDRRGPHTHSKPRRRISRGELIDQIASLERKNDELEQESDKWFQKAEERRREVRGRIQEISNLQDNLEGLQNAYNQLEKKNNGLLEKVARLRSRLDEERTFHDDKIAGLESIHQEKQGEMLRQQEERENAWASERATLASNHEMEKRDMVSKHHMQESIWHNRERDLLSHHQEEKNKLSAALISQHQEEKNKLSAAHQNELVCKDEKHKGEIEQLKKEHAEENRHLKTQVKIKQQQLASYSSSSSYVATSDQQLRASFQNLSQEVSNLTALIPQPPNIEHIAHSDPNSYLKRHLEQVDRSWPRFVQSLCWTVLHEGFFALPLGFGALGKGGEGGEKLKQLWQLFEKHIKGVGSNFSTSGKHANIWRATLFDAIWREVTSTLPLSSEHDFAALLRSNISHVSENLFAELQKLSAGELDSRAKPLIKKICKGLGLLSLQMGTQRAQILLEIVRHGDSITPDEKFEDEMDGTKSEIKVDIVTKPCMRRVGDGREDGHTQSVILKGSVVSLKVSRTQVNRR
ncbi:hypothetical protein PFICI_13054 [Pestalotiopsis fici W106-1]|uniref:Uncharacterized protein n=1 Tax=Pestalotiopsis fici (strain W106-1 / CGMCC3.15140) TaxID=1229662 RepID=W3WKW6_PESFW|nr:uncharacterized protein PFICI_13054 [Pestalotiopsis fici W106-1]ETS74570.1 hypothetical protein PFICI_13054 [Pestalotiopsis fici W106-1]